MIYLPGYRFRIQSTVNGFIHAGAPTLKQDTVD